MKTTAKTTSEILANWHAGSSAGSITVDRERAFAEVGNSLILDVQGWHYQKYHVSGTGRYVVLAWDDSGNEVIE